jgi:hypothetical protein
MFQRLISIGGVTPVLLLAFASLLGACGSSSEDEDKSGGQGLDGVIFGEGATAENDGRTGFDGQVCAGQSAGAEVAPSVLQLLVDTSGSMDQDAPGGGSKWTVTRRAVLDAIDGMPGDTSLGVTFYPNVPNDRQPCLDRRAAVGLAQLAGTGSQQRQQIRNAFQRQDPQGGTPTHDAYRAALGEVAATVAAGSRFVVLITDGTPTYSLGCIGTGQIQDPVDPGPLIPEAASALSQGIRTFVIGSPGSEGARESLSRMAEAGGTARDGCSHTGRPNYCHFDMTSERDLGAGLDSALQAISGLALSCRYDVPQPPNGSLLDPAKVNVLFTPPGGTRELILQSSSQTCSEGWQYSSGNNQIQLCGSTCDRVRSSNGGLTLEFGCTTQVR